MPTYTGEARKVTSSLRDAIAALSSGATVQSTRLRTGRAVVWNSMIAPLGNYDRDDYSQGRFNLTLPSQPGNLPKYRLRVSSLVTVTMPFGGTMTIATPLFRSNDLPPSDADLTVYYRLLDAGDIAWLNTQPQFGSVSLRIPYTSIGDYLAAYPELKNVRVKLENGHVRIDFEYEVSNLPNITGKIVLEGHPSTSYNNDKIIELEMIQFRLFGPIYGPASPFVRGKVEDLVEAQSGSFNVLAGLPSGPTVTLQSVDERSTHIRVSCAVGYLMSR